MLKIKDNVDLKELKKYGFKYYNRKRIYDNPCYEHIKEDIAININKWEEPYIGNMERREVVSLSWDFNEDLLELIYDLTKNGLLEKVEVDNNEND